MKNVNNKVLPKGLKIVNCSIKEKFKALLKWTKQLIESFNQF